MWSAKRDVTGTHFCRGAREDESAGPRVSQTLTHARFFPRQCPCPCSGWHSPPFSPLGRSQGCKGSPEHPWPELRCLAASSDRVPTLGMATNCKLSYLLLGSLPGPREWTPDSITFLSLAAWKVSCLWGELHGPPGHLRTWSWLSQSPQAYWQLRLSGVQFI